MFCGKLFLYVPYSNTFSEDMFYTNMNVCGKLYVPSLYKVDTRPFPDARLTVNFIITEPTNQCE